MSGVVGSIKINNGLIYFQDISNTKSLKEGEGVCDLVKGSVAVLENGLDLYESNKHYIQLDGTNDYINADDVVTLMNDTSECTYSIWVRPESLSARTYVYSFTPTTSYPVMGLAYSAEFMPPTSLPFQSNRFDFLCANGTGNRWILQTDEEFPINNFYNVCVTKTSGGNSGNMYNFKMYINGVEKNLTFIQDISTNDWWNDNLSFSNFSIGGLVRSNSSSNYMLGKWNSFSIYDRALKPSEILKNYNSLKVRFIL